jgi:hypothetical protein
MIGRKKKEEAKKEFRRKNISPILTDIRHPSVSRFYSPHNATASSGNKKVTAKKPVVRKDVTPRKRAEVPDRPKVSVATTETSKRFELSSVSASRKRRARMRYAVPTMALVVILSSFGLWNLKEDVVGSSKAAFNDFQAAISAAQKYDADGIKKSLISADRGVENIEGKTGFLKLIPFLKEIPAFIGSIRELNRSAFSVITATEQLKKEGMSWIWGDGDKLLSTLKDIRRGADLISSFGGEVRNKLASIGMADGFSGGYLSMQSEIFGATGLIDGVISLLEGESYMAIFFMNDSEMRPSGGFIGSYAVVKLSGGEIEDISVNDIYYPDKFLETKIIPPSPMQAITADWEARDANWFFDFPTSASKVLGLMESSSVYADKNIKFKGALAMNHKVVTDILKVTGPVELPEYNMVLDETNFLETIQDEVARDSDIRGGERKNVLKSLLPEMVKRMKAMSSVEKKAVTDAIDHRLKNKDIQIYSTDKRIESFVVKQQWAGEVYDLPDSVFGDYLAVVTANLGGEKTDAYMRQKVTVKSVIEESGRVKNQVLITRVHGGKNADKSFYRVPNQSYVRILAPEKAQVVTATGATEKKITPKKNYAKEGYASDQDVMAFESGMESGKKVFGYWMTVVAGTDKTLSVDYERAAVFSEKFRFVYEKQSGSDSAISYAVEAPLGYIFKETGTSEFTYNNDDPPARLVIELNLEKI